MVFFSCNSSNTDSHYVANDSLTAKGEVQDVNLYIKTHILDYYMKELKTRNTETPAMKILVDSNHIDKEFSFLNGIELREINSEDSSSGGTYVVPFEKNYIKGDLNGDSQDDYVIPVYATGGGSSEWREIFVFISKNKRLEYFKMYSSFDLAHCDSKGSNGGQFYPNKISNSILTGESYCYLESDPHCCPSIKMQAQYKFDNGLIFSNQTPIK